MDTKPVPVSDGAGLTVTGGDEVQAASAPVVRGQNLTVALLPLAIIGLLVASFVAAAWTFLAALPPG